MSRLHVVARNSTPFELDTTDALRGVFINCFVKMAVIMISNHIIDVANDKAWEAILSSQ